MCALALGSWGEVVAIAPPPPPGVSLVNKKLRRHSTDPQLGGPLGPNICIEYASRPPPASPCG
eukprot:7881955-Karenia_brevis.AAC.1